MNANGRQQALKRHGYNIETTIDAYAQLSMQPPNRPARSSDTNGPARLLSGSTAARLEQHRPALDKLFDQYRGGVLPAPKRKRKRGRSPAAANPPPGPPGDDADRMFIDATMQYLTDLQVPLDSITVLIFSTILNCPAMGEVTREGFFTGWAEHGATTIAQQKTLLSTLTSQLQSAPVLQKNPPDALSSRTYKQTFTIALPTGTRAVPLDMATEYWRLLFSEQSGTAWKTASTPWLSLWIAFLERSWKKAVNKDLWSQTLRFAQETMLDEQMRFWSEDGAWPGVIDDFVGHVREARASGESMDMS